MENSLLQIHISQPEAVNVFNAVVWPPHDDRLSVTALLQSYYAKKNILPASFQLLHRLN